MRLLLVSMVTLHQLTTKLLRVWLIPVLMVQLTFNVAIAAQFDIPNPAPNDGFADFVFEFATGVLRVHTDSSSINSLVILGPKPQSLLDGGGAWPTENDVLNQQVVVNNPPRSLMWDAIFFNQRQQWILTADSANTGITTSGAIARYVPDAFESTSSKVGDIEYTTFDPTDPSDLVRTRLIFVSGVAGDYTGNKLVDAADYVVWRHTLGSPTIPSTVADGNGNGIVDQLDYTYWKLNFGSNQTSVSDLPHIVPEPVCTLHLISLAMARLRRRRTTFANGIHNQRNVAHTIPVMRVKRELCGTSWGTQFHL